jgi:hypothetical protein
MAELKTKPTRASVAAFLKKSAPDPEIHRDCQTLVKLMQQVTGEKATMWGQSIVGFGTYHYAYGSGREGSWLLTGFSPRKKDLTLYITAGVERYPELLKKLGRYRNGKGCLYLKRLADVDMPVLKALITASVRDMKRRKT